MLATDFDVDKVTQEQWRVIDRLGSRDVAGIKRAMRQHKVNSIDELAKILKHHEAKSKPLDRLKLSFGRLFGHYNHNPHGKEFHEAFKAKKPQDLQIIERVKYVKQ
jgi:hypothetical protein